MASNKSLTLLNKVYSIFIFLFILLIHVCNTVLLNDNELDSNYIIPHLDTVLGLTFSNESVSIIIDIKSGILIISLLGKHNFLLSSNTVFISSVHLVSTGPSNIIAYLLISVVLIVSCMHLLNKYEN